MQRQYFIYLNRLRESGDTNMFGAAPYLQEEFGLNRAEARRTLADWMHWVEQDPERLDQ